ncbi:MAG: TetR/AcrR family transcriptional regulator [Chloroflexota bacterium]
MTDTPIADKRTAIMDATRQLIVERGFHNTPMSQIASQAGVSAGTVYHYFENKDDLIRQLYWHTKARMGAALMSQDLMDLPFTEQIKTVWLRAYRFYVANPEATQYLEQYENSTYYKPVDVSDFDENMQALFIMMQTGMQQGELKRLPAPVLHEIWFNAAARIARQQVNGTINLDEETLDQIAESVCGAVLA